MRKNLPLAAVYLGLKASNRHMANRTFILDRRNRFRVIDRFAPNAALPIRIARRIPHHARPPSEADGNIFTRGCHDSILASQAPAGTLKLRLESRTLPPAA